MVVQEMGFGTPRRLGRTLSRLRRGRAGPRGGFGVGLGAGRSESGRALRSGEGVGGEVGPGAGRRARGPAGNHGEAGLTGRAWGSPGVTRPLDRSPPAPPSLASGRPETRGRARVDEGGRACGARARCRGERAGGIATRARSRAAAESGRGIGARAGVDGSRCGEGGRRSRRRACRPALVSNGRARDGKPVSCKYRDSEPGYHSSQL